MALVKYTRAYGPELLKKKPPQKPSLPSPITPTSHLQARSPTKLRKKNQEFCLQEFPQFSGY
ncbi:MAG: hypothetical protein DRI93_04205 [Aquificota bacterium]|nr:MAG: hypothetical protein DRI93_04205 [Aquificota bacterium]